MKWVKRLNEIAEWAVLGVGFAILLFLTSLVWRNQFDARSSYPIHTNMVYQVIVLVGVLGLGILIFILEKKRTVRQKNIICCILQIAAVVYLLVIGMSFVSQLKILPASDSKSCFDIAQRFLASDFTAVVPKDSYLSLWPFQTGFIFLLEKQMRIFHTTDPVFFQRMNVLFLVLIVVSGYQIIRCYTKCVSACFLYLVLMCTYFPIIFYAYLIYGNIPAMAMMMFSMWMYLFFERTEIIPLKIATAICFFGSTVLACVYKPTCKIYLIALLIATVFTVIREKNYIKSLFVLITLIAAMLIPVVVQRYYENYAHDNCGDGVPAVAYLAMGLQYNGEEAIPGGWNGYHANLYMETGYDSVKTSEISKESIKDSLSKFKDDPSYMSMFFYNKLLKQWANQTHAVFWSMDAFWDTNRNQASPWVKFVETGKYENWLIFIDCHESVVYGVLLLGLMGVIYCKVKRKGNNTNLQNLLPLIIFIGGFLFSIIWEGQTQAVLYYPVLLLPYAVAMMFLCAEFILETRSGRSFR